MDASPSTDRKPRRRSAMAMLILLVASVAILFRVWRDAMEASPASGLVAAIRSGSEEARMQAMEGLWQFSPEDGKVVAPALFEALQDPNPTIRAMAVGSLGFIFQNQANSAHLGVAAEKLRGVLADPEPAVRRSAVLTLGALYQPNVGALPGSKPPVPVLPTREVASALVAMVDDHEPTVREAAVAVLGDMFARPEAALELFLTAAKDSDQDVRATAVRRLSSLTPKSKTACLAVVKAMRDPSGRVRNWALISHVNNQAVPSPGVAIPPEAVPDLIAVLEEPEAPKGQFTLKIHALNCLERIGPAAKAVLPLILAHAGAEPPTPLTDPAIRCLGSVAPGSAEAGAMIPKGLAALRSPEWSTRLNAIDQLATFTWDPAVLKALRGTLRDPNEMVRRRAQQWVTPLGVDDRETEPVP